MSSSVTNRLTISGNEKVKKFVNQLNKELIDDQEINGIRNRTAIRRLIYKHSQEFSDWLSDATNTKEIYFIDESDWRPTQSCITFVSENSTIEELQDYLLITLSQLDPCVLICNQSHDDYLENCNTRYSLMCDLAPAEISTSTPIPTAKNQNDAFYKKVDNLILKNKKKAFEMVKKTFPWLTDEHYL